METVLQFLKLDLGISHTLRDPYFNGLLEANKLELEGKGFTLNIENDVEDQILLSDYTAWKYRNRTEDVPIAKNINSRIKDRIIRERGNSYVG